MRTRRPWLRGAVIATGVVAAIVVGVPLVIAVLALLVGLAGLVIGLALAFGPWLALGAGGYYLARRSRRSRLRREAWAAAWAAQQQPVPAGAPAPPAPPAAAETGLPPEHRAQVDRIRRKAQALLLQANRFPADGLDLHLVRRTQDEYLPATLEAFLALPPSAGEWAVSPDGRTGRQMLQDQLDLLETKMDEVHADLRQHNLQRLLVNERFLEERFGRTGAGELTIPPPGHGSGEG